MSGIEKRGYTPPSSDTDPADLSTKKARLTPEDREQMLELIDASLEYMIQESMPYNEGNNGVIYTLKMESMTPTFREAMKQLGYDLEGTKAAKVLKAYFSGEGRQEHGHQLAASQALADKKGDSSYACVPEPYIFRDIELDEETAEKLQRDTGRRDRPNRAEIFLMDYVPGEDLATSVYRKILETVPDPEFMLGKYGVRLAPGESIADAIRGLRLDELQTILGQEIGLQSRSDNMLPGGAEEQAVNRANAKKILQVARRSGKMVPDSRIGEQLSNSIKALHDAGIAHRDMHPRNVMVEGDPFGVDSSEPPRVYIIDFGSAQQFKPGTYSQARESLYVNNSGERRPPDEDILAFLKGLNPAEGQAEQGSELGFEEFVATQEKRFAKQSSAKKKFDRIRDQTLVALESLSKYPESAVVHYQRGDFAAPKPAERALLFVYALSEIVKQQPDKLEKVRAIIGHLMPKVSEPEQKVLRQMLDRWGE
jgi:tRNA A-37 threonylcarbamoyl transferase component Bud32